MGPETVPRCSIWHIPARRYKETPGEISIRTLRPTLTHRLLKICANVGTKELGPTIREIIRHCDRRRNTSADEFAERAEVLPNVFDVRKLRGSQLKACNMDGAIRVHPCYNQLVDRDDFGNGARRREEKI
jgi:hypothetical protein